MLPVSLGVQVNTDFLNKSYFSVDLNMDSKVDFQDISEFFLEWLNE